MKIPSWFVIGCGLLALNLILVLGGTVSRFASAEPPDDTQTLSESQPASAAITQPDVSILNPDAASLPPTLASEPTVGLPTFPSLDANGPPLSSVFTLDEIKKAVDEIQPSPDFPEPLDAILQSSRAPISEELSHSYFESIKLRLQTVEHLNQSTMGLVDEAAMLYQRGETAEAQKLLGVATQLRETTARLLVTHQ